MNRVDGQMAVSTGPDYPWYAAVSGDELEQGDILLRCPVFQIPAEAESPATTTVQVDVFERNAIVMSQSCDLAIRDDGRCNLDEVILCRVYFKDELRSHPRFGKQDQWEMARKGRLPAYHVLNKCDLSEISKDFAADFMLVDLRQVYSLPVPLVRQLARNQNPRVRLLPPYREHLSQAFARFFMRVGLPVDVPPFTKQR